MPTEKGVTAAGLRHGLFLGVFLVLYGLFFRMAEIHHRAWPSWIFYLALPVAAFLAVQSQRTAAGGGTFLQGFGAASLASALGSALYGVSVFVLNRFVDDSLLRAVVADARQGFTERGLSGEELAAAVKLAEALARPVPFSLLVTLQLMLVGIASGALAALLLRRS